MNADQHYERLYRLIVRVIFAAPLLVVAYVMVKKLYVQEALGTDTPIPGEKRQA